MSHDRPVDFATLDDWLEWQQSVSVYEIELRLDRVRAVLDRLDLDLPAPLITVAGTNGKGSTAAMLEALLAATGRRVGVYTSPHLSDYNERIRLAGRNATNEEIVGAFRRIEAVRDGVALTFFEFGTLAALILIAASGVDAAVLEVGLGGRLDAVNAVEPDAAIITSIALDHQRYLGTDRERIGFEKAGIMRPGKPAVYSGADIPASVRQRALEIGADLKVAGEDFVVRPAGDGWSWRGARNRFAALPRPALAGSHQIANAGGALALLESLGPLAELSAGMIATALETLTLPGRQQRIGSDPEWIVDVAHNPEAAAVLAATLAASPAAGRTLALVGMLNDKDIAGTITPLVGLVDDWFAVGITGRRGLAADTLAQAVANAANTPCRVLGDIDAGVDEMTRIAGCGDRIVAFGSFLLAGPVLRKLEL